MDITSDIFNASMGGADIGRKTNGRWKEQTMSNRVCGECRFHKYFALKNLDFMGITIEEWYCDNWYSKRSGQITQYNDTCEEWAEEEREGE